ncbi:MAG TPA: hypothetical protein VI522_03325 [Gammaproteobacteria bacterium]|nr:hypothetical protein [Gammaproteobacteria bacterium]
MIKKYLLVLSFFCVTLNAHAYVCEQATSVPLEKAQEEVAKLSQKFTRIDHIEILPQTSDLTKNQMILKTVHLILCGEIMLETPPQQGTALGQACHFDSSCAMPMRCQNNLCTLPF